MSKVQFFFSLKCATNHAIFTCQLSHLKNHSNHIPKPSISFKSPSKCIKPIFHFSSTLEPINRALIIHNWTHKKFFWVVKKLFSLLPHLVCVDELFFSSSNYCCPFGKVPSEFCPFSNFVPLVVPSFFLFFCFFLAFYFFLAFLHFILFLFSILIIVIYFPAIRMYLGPM